MNELKPYLGRLKDPKLIFIIILALAIVVVMAINPSSESFEIEDKCGKFVNVMSHTIEDENACKTRCRSQCDSTGLRYRKARFEKSELGCNSCTCNCK